MRFMVIVKATEDSEKGAMPSQDMLEAMGAYNEELVKAGVMLDGDGLRPSSYGARVRFDDEGNASVIDGPFAETKELVSGYWVFEVSSKEEAVEWARKAPFRGGELEIRPFSVPEDFGEAFTPELQEKENELRGAEQPAQRVSTPPAPTASATADLHRVVDAVWRMESARIVGALTRVTGDVGQAEELAQDALVAALEQWPESGVPAKPGAWLMAIAKHRAIDSFRRSQNLQRKTVELGRELVQAEGVEEDWAAALDEVVEDDVLRLVFISCHPVLSREARVAHDPAAGRRPRDRRDRPRLPGAGEDAGAADRAGQGSPSPPPACRSRCPPARTSPPGSPRCSRCSTWSSTRGTRPPRGRTSPGRPSARRRCGWAASWPASCPGSPRCTGCSPSWSCRRRGWPRGSARTASRCCWPTRTAAAGTGCWSTTGWRRWPVREETAGGALGPYALQAGIAACHARARSVEETDWAAHRRRSTRRSPRSTPRR